MQRKNIMVILRHDNAVRPRISDLINGNSRHNGGFIEEVGDCKCSVTGKTVRLVRIALVKEDKPKQLGLWI